MVVVALFIGLGSYFAALPASAAEFSLEPPPGWEKTMSARQASGVVAAFRGPEASSFILTRVGGSALDNRGATRAFLVDVLAELNKKAGLSFTISGPLEEASYDNGASIKFIRAQLQGKPRLILAAIDFNGAQFLGTLNSSVPDTLLGAIIASLREDSDAAARSVLSRLAASIDGELNFSLPDGLLARHLSEREKKLSFMLAVQGFDSELMILKSVDDSTSLKDQPMLVRSTVLAIDGVEPASVLGPVFLKTPAGPGVVYAWGRVIQEATPSEFAAGYLPWCYWGYSILAKGPRAHELLAETFKTLSPGAASSAKLVRGTPMIPMPHAFGIKRIDRRLLVPFALLGMILAAALWVRFRG